MSARGGGRRRRGGHAGEHENEERWLLTYSDMITLLMALFMVLFSISAVNKSKLQVLSQSLQQAFSGQILPGGKSIQNFGGGNQSQQQTPTPPIPAIQPLIGMTSTPSGAQTATQTQTQSPAAQDQQFEQLKRQIDEWARRHGLQNQVQTAIEQRGLVVRLLTDKVLFDSGQAELKPAATPMLDRVGQLVNTTTNPVMVEGHTDDVPISGSQYPTNWELSTARASRVVRFLIESGVSAPRLSAAGYASLHPIASNDTADGRAHNRRVEIVLLRSGQGAAGGGVTP